MEIESETPGWRCGKATSCWWLLALIVAACGGDAAEDQKRDASSPAEVPFDAGNAPEANSAPEAGSAADAGSTSDAGTRHEDAGDAGQARSDAGAWPAPAGDCSDLGHDCPCSDQVICNLGVDLCLPRHATAGSFLNCAPGTCAPETPYCVAGQCMSEKEATCVCTQPGAKERVPVCEAGPQAALGAPNACLNEQAICANAPGKCCAGLTCVQAPDVVPQCFKPCTTNADCAGRCCVDAGANGKICDPTSACS
jgi:hypothetical protein